jgi:hypothetical protein
MVIAALVMMAADSGELETAADVDVMLYEMAKSTHRDATFWEVVDALLDVRDMIIRQHPDPLAEPALAATPM